MFRKYLPKFKKIFKRKYNSEFDHTIETPEKNSNSFLQRQNFGLGLLLLTFGIPFVALNERRATAQKKLRELSEIICTEVDPTNQEDILLKNNQLVYTVGHVDLTNQDSFPKDDLFGVTKNSTPKALKIQRSVQMYQWVEHSKKETKIDENGKEKQETTFTYEKKWKDVHQKFESPDSRRPPNNPKFPSGLKGGTFSSEVDLSLGRIEIKKNLNSKFINDFDPMKLTECNIENENQFGFRRENQYTLYTGNGNLNEPVIGDILVKFRYIPEEFYSGIGKLKDSKLGYFRGSLRENLKDQGEIQIPNKEINDILGFSNQGIQFQFFIPEITISMTEFFLLKMAPLRIGFLKRGIHEKKKLFEMIKKEDEIKNEIMRAIGFFIVVFGCNFAMSPIRRYARFIPKGNTSVNITALFASAMITTKTIEMNRSKVESE
jgi:hypothetical protein